MERKTIGGFIAALRKANGMTQRELAERLNVSDKTVSRWERDDGVPDLSVIPVIAEIFNVTCDELLRGERKPMSERIATSEHDSGMEKPAASEPDAMSAKAEKQKQRILVVSLSKYKNRSFIAMGIALVGLIAAMIANFGFLRAYIGFFIGIIFYLVSVICQAVFINNAFLSVADDSLDRVEIGKFKKNIIKYAEYSFGLTAILFGTTLPLIIFPWDTYVGLSGSSWFGHGLIFGLLALVIYSAVFYFVNAVLVNKGIYYLNEKEARIYHINHILKRNCVLLLAAILAAAGIIHFLVAATWNNYIRTNGIVFNDYESFVEYMEQDIHYHYQDDWSNSSTTVIPNTTIYYDEFGNEISEDEALRRTLTINDGTEEGKVVCEYIERNQMVAYISYTQKFDSLLPITVVTYEHLRAGQAKGNLINVAFMAVYFVEVVGIFIFYLKKREN